MINITKLPTQDYAKARAVAKHIQLNETVQLQCNDYDMFVQYITLWQNELKHFYVIKNISYLSINKIEIKRAI